MDKTLIQQLDSIYCENTIGEGDHTTHNQCHWLLLQQVNRSLRLPVLGEANTGLQTPLGQLPAATKEFPNMKREMAFYEQALLECQGLLVPPNYYKRYPQELAALYLLNSSACEVARKDGKRSVRCSSVDVIKSFPKELLENYSERHDAYLSVDARPDVERGVLRGIELRPTSSHRIRLYCLQTPVKGSVIVPRFLMEEHVKKILRILSRNEVTLRYKEANGSISTFNTSLQKEWLRRYCGADAEVIQARCLNASGVELTLAVVPVDTKGAQVKTIGVLGICSIVKA